MFCATLTFVNKLNHSLEPYLTLPEWNENLWPHSLHAYPSFDAVFSRWTWFASSATSLVEKTDSSKYFLHISCRLERFSTSLSQLPGTWKLLGLSELQKARYILCMLTSFISYIWQIISSSRSPPDQNVNSTFLIGFNWYFLEYLHNVTYLS